MKLFHFFNLFGRCNLVSLGLDIVVLVVQHTLDLRFEKVNRAGHRQDEQEGGKDEPCVKMPPPDRLIGRFFRFVFHK